MFNLRIAGCLALAIALVNIAWPAQTGGRIKGNTCYPSEYLPPMTVYARNTKTGKTYSTYVKGNVGKYTLKVPAGTYIVFAWTEKIPDRSGGSYSQAVPCGLNVSCSDHSPIPITVEPGKTVTGINPCDFYSAKDVPLPSAQDEKPALVPVQCENDEDAPLVITEAAVEISAPYETILKGTKGDGQEVTLVNKGEKARRIKLTLTMVNKSNLTVFQSIVRLLNPAFLSDESILVGSRLWIRNPGWPLEIKPQETFTVTTDLPLADRRNGQELANHLSGFRVKVVESGFSPEGSPTWTEGGDFSNLYGRVENMVMVIDCAGGTVFRLVKERLPSEPPPTRTSGKLAPKGILVPTQPCGLEIVYKRVSPYEIGRPAPDGLQASGAIDSETPVIFYHEKAKYTEDALRNETQGMVLLYVSFKANGTISDISVKAGLPDALTEKAIEAARKIRFQPAVKGGVPISVRRLLLFSFTLY